MRSIIRFFLVSVAITITLSGCVQGNSITTEQAEMRIPSFTPPPDSTVAPKSTATFPPNPTSPPTLSPDQALQMLEALEDESCKLPCYLGIVPGQTSTQDARAILLGLGGSYSGEYIRETDGALYFTYEFDMGNQANGERIISHSVSLITNNDIVQVMDVWASPMLDQTAFETYRAYWRRYSAHQIFSQLGEPENLSIHRIVRGDEIGSDLIVLYDEHIAIDLYGTKVENNLCPTNESTSLYSNMLLSYPGSTLSIYGDGRVPFTDQEIYPPVEDVIGIDVSEFYNSVITDPTTCFEISQDNFSP